MASTSESGHAKNVANFEDLISFCTGYGTTFNPSKNAIKLIQLNTLLTNAKNSLNVVNTSLNPFNIAVNAREIEERAFPALPFVPGEEAPACSPAASSQGVASIRRWVGLTCTWRGASG